MSPPAFSLPLFQQARIASPCSMRWEEMTPTGDAHTRRCEQCDLNVHNFAGMTAEQAESVLRSAFNADGTRNRRICAGIYRRVDGTIITADCPVGLAAVRAKARRTVARIAAAVGLTTVVAWAAARESAGFAFAGRQPINTVANYLRGAPAPTPVTSMTLGDICIPAPAPAPPVLNWLNNGVQP